MTTRTERDDNGKQSFDNLSRYPAAGSYLTLDFGQLN